MGKGLGLVSVWPRSGDTERSSGWLDALCAESVFAPTKWRLMRKGKRPRAKDGYESLETVGAGVDGQCLSSELNKTCESERRCPFWRLREDETGAVEFVAEYENEAMDLGLKVSS